MTSEPKKNTPVDDITRIQGIGATRKQWFYDNLNVRTIRDMAALSAEEVEAKIKEDGLGITTTTINEWLSQAAEFAAASAEGEQSDTEFFEAAADALEAAGDTLEDRDPVTTDGAVDTGPGVFGKSVYATAYYLTYGVVFGSLLVAKAVPMNNAMGTGLRDGTQAAQDAFGEREKQRAHQRATEEEALADELVDSLSEEEAGLATT